LLNATIDETDTEMSGADARCAGRVGGGNYDEATWRFLGLETSRLITEGGT
jgi:hypothetical protein